MISHESAKTTGIRHDGQPQTASMRSGAEVTDRWTVWVNRMSALLLLLGVTALILDADVSNSRRLLGTAVALALLCWHTAMLGEHFYHPPRRTYIYVVVAVPLVMALFQVHPAFMMLSFTSYWTVYAITQPLWLATIPAALLTLALITPLSVDRLDNLVLDPWFVTLFGGMLLFGGILSLFISSIVRQNERQQELIQQLAETRSELARNERDAGRMAERQRLAGDIHDTIAQDLTSIVLHLETAKPHIQSDHQIALHHLDVATSMARSGLTDARQIVHALLPDVLVGQTLVEALKGESASWAQSARIETAFHCHGELPRLPAEVEVTLLRVLQESLTNVRKHANGTHVNITLSYLKDQVILDIRDNGKGMPAAPRAPDGFCEAGMHVGLRTMRDRLAHLGGELAIESESGEGTTIAASIPVGSRQISAPSVSPTNASSLATAPDRENGGIR